MSKLKESGFFLLLLMSIILVNTALLFFIHIPISSFHLPVFIILTSLIYFLLRKKETKKEIFKIIGISIFILIISILVASFLFDRSSDGNTYHKDAIGVLKEGFNPVYQDSKDFINNRKDNRNNLDEYSIWIDHYAKANWIIEANIYSLTNNIESGKAINFISIYIVFSFLYSTLVNVLDKKKALILSLITVINPITAAQMLTYYNDQLVYLYLFLAILFLIKIDKDINDMKSWFYYFLTFIILANMKFNGLGYLLVFSFLFVCRYLYKAFKNKNFIPTFKKLSLIFIPLFVVSLLIVGYPTYIKNTIYHNNPFFPLYDENGEDIITQQQPKKFNSMNNIEKLFYATFSKVNNLKENDKTTLKIPFTIYKDEIIPAMSIDTRISGWGIFFSGLLLVSIVVLIKEYKFYKQESWLLYTLGITVLLLVIMSEAWWCRYTPHFYLFIILSLYILFKNKKRNNWLIFIYTGIICINTLIPLLGNSYFTLKNSINFLKDVSKIDNKEIIINERGMHGILYNLNDFNISYYLDDNIEGNKLYYKYLDYKAKD